MLLALCAAANNDAVRILLQWTTAEFGTIPARCGSFAVEMAASLLALLPLAITTMLSISASIRHRQ